MKKKALFLDRDGIINVEKNYVYKIEDFEFMDGIFEILRFFQEKGYLLIIITNQAGIGRGYYTEEEFHILTAWMLKQFELQGIYITKVEFSPYHPEHGLGKYKLDSDCRKPNPGMILRSAKEFDVDLTESILIGDKDSDIEAGLRAGVNKNILISNGENISINERTANVIENNYVNLLSFIEKGIYEY
ncbi:HAD family hydrolase [Paenibacillus psychroresistens]|uniref:D,D-heptose 1,7-bisphosphate phosphatase n=1 Tax=Paenibacillus psychroresistens TaxID=1778678 RepID=A0A6B8RSG0_9BACL|nr:HAD family hydrolase [Paenibacillus psychroresistens]QGQ98485.1 HAD family hydrolase [Paenibacillus psychroresistens]